MDKYESATVLYEKNGMKHVVYDTNKGPCTKSGFVKFQGCELKNELIPYKTFPGAEQKPYGKSGLGRPLIAHKIGNGNKALVFVCAVHGFEDNWYQDGLALVRIGNELIEHLAANGTYGWSVYVIPAANPDGLEKGTSKNGPGRCTVVGHVDINRDFPTDTFQKHGSSRCWSGDHPLSVNESKCLSNFILDIKSKHNELFVIDLHGWEQSAIGDEKIKKYFMKEFTGSNSLRSLGFDHRSFLTTWVKEKGATAALIELPRDTHSLDDVINKKYPEKVINSVVALLKGNISTNTDNDHWSQENGKWYYYINGSKATGWKSIDGKWYYLNDDGVMLTGWQSLGGKWYYLNSDGSMATGTQTIGGKQYTFDNSGELISEASFDTKLFESASSLMKVFKIEIDEFKLNKSFFFSIPPFDIEYEFGLQAQLGTGSTTIAIENGKATSIEPVWGILSSIFPSSNPSLSSILVGNAKEFFTKLTHAITLGSIKYSLNIEKKTLEIEIAKEIPKTLGKKLYTKISISLHDYFNEIFETLKVIEQKPILKHAIPIIETLIVIIILSVIFVAVLEVPIASLIGAIVALLELIATKSPF